MLWNSSAFNGYAIQASDGNFGTVTDILFEDVNWTVRWLVVDTGNWLSGRKVLLPFSALGHPDRDLRLFPVTLTKQQVKDSPDIDTDMSVSRQHEAHIFDFYGFDPYWGGGLYPVSNAMAVPFLAPLAPEERHQPDSGETLAPAKQGDPHLRSVEALVGYHIHTSDGDIGHVADILVDDVTWTMRYIIVDTGNWWPGQLVLIAPQTVLEIDWAERQVHLNVDRAKVKGSPPYAPAMTVDGAYDERYQSYYGINWGGM